MHNDMQERVTRVEQRLDEGERRFKELTELMAASNAGIASLNIAVAKLTTSIEERAKIECPHVVLCSAIDGKIKAVEIDVASLKSDRTQAIGGWKALGVLFGAIATLVGAFAAIAAIYRNLFHN